MDKDHVRHKHPMPKKDISRDCTKCAHAKKVADHEWECDAVLYDLRKLTCFVPRNEEQDT